MLLPDGPTTSSGCAVGPNRRLQPIQALHLTPCSSRGRRLAVINGEVDGALLCSRRCCGPSTRRLAGHRWPLLIGFAGHVDKTKAALAARFAIQRQAAFLTAPYSARSCGDLLVRNPRRDCRCRWSREKGARRPTMAALLAVCIGRWLSCWLVELSVGALRLRLVPMCLSGLFPAAVERRTRLHGLASHGCPSAL